MYHFKPLNLAMNLRSAVKKSTSEHRNFLMQIYPFPRNIREKKNWPAKIRQLLKRTFATKKKKQRQTEVNCLKGIEPLMA